MIVGIHHVGICTRDIDRLIKFYREGLGFELVMEGEWSNSGRTDRIVGLPGSSARKAMLRAANLYLELFEYHSPPSRKQGESRLDANDCGYTHIALQVTDIDAEFARLSKAGIVFNAPLEPNETVTRSMYGRDPDGNYIEIMQHLTRNGREMADLPIARRDPKLP